MTAAQSWLYNVWLWDSQQLCLLHSAVWGGGRGGGLQNGWQQREEVIEIVIMSVKGWGWPPAPPLFNNPIISGSFLTGGPAAACVYWIRAQGTEILYEENWMAGVLLWMNHTTHWQSHTHTHMVVLCVWPVPVSIINGDIIPLTWRWRQCGRKVINWPVKGREEEVARRLTSSSFHCRAWQQPHSMNGTFFKCRSFQIIQRKHCSCRIKQSINQLKTEEETQFYGAAVAQLVESCDRRVGGLNPSSGCPDVKV